MFGGGGAPQALFPSSSPTFAGLTVSAGTLTTDTQIARFLATWNAAGVTFEGVQVVITDTSSAAGSLPFQILGGAAGATNLLSVSKGGALSIGGSLDATSGNVVGGSGAYLAWSSRSLMYSPADSAIRFTNNASTAFSTLQYGPEAAATTSVRIQKKVTGIADNTATDVFTVTVPNANHACAIKVTLLSSNGSTDAFESSRVAEGAIVVARTTGANAVAAAASLTLAQIATVSGGATHTLAYDVSSISGAVGDPNTFTIRVTIDDSGNLGSNQVVAVAELINAEATGVTIA